jgi:hypothetical protein
MKEKKIAIVQSNYIPWKGYFDMIAAVDEFIIYDDMQYTKRDWRNRNQIKTPQGLLWITVPVRVKGKYYQKIRDTEIDAENWQLKHWKTIHANYQCAPYFSELAKYFEPYYTQNSYSYLSQLNRALIETVNSYLGITTKISNSWDYELSGEKTERLANLCCQAGGTEYISGPAAKNYINEDIFKDKGIKLTWFSYKGYPEYPQQWGLFIHQVTILDLLFNCGKNSAKYLKYVKL